MSLGKEAVFTFSGEPMQVISQDQGWVIAKNFRTIDASSVLGSRSHAANRVRNTYECWNGERWLEQRSAAKIFPSAEEAQQYLDENRDQLAQ